MSTCITMKPRVRLVNKAASGPGVGIHEAVAAAEAQVEVLRSSATARIDAIVLRLEALRGTLAAGAGTPTGEFRALADELTGLCGPFGLTAMGDVASSLCRLLDSAAPRALVAKGIAVHLDTLHLLAKDDARASGEAAANLLSGLRKVVAALNPGQA